MPVLSHWFDKPPSPFPRPDLSPVVLDPGVFPSRSVLQSQSLEFHPLLELRLLQSLTGPCRRPFPDLAAGVSSTPLMGSLAPSTFEARWSHHSGAYLTPFVALSGFLSLSVLCSPPHRPALFHAGDALGVLPFRASSSQGAVPPLDGRCPHAVAPRLPRPKTRSARPSSSGPCSPWEFATNSRWVRPPAGPVLSWVFNLSRAFPLVALGSASTTLLSQAWRGPPSPRGVLSLGRASEEFRP